MTFKTSLINFFDAEADLTAYQALPAEERASRFRELADLANEVEQRRKVARLNARQIYKQELPLDWRPTRERYPNEFALGMQRRTVREAELKREKNREHR